MTHPSPTNQPLIVAALYKFAPMHDLEQLQAALQDLCDAQGVCGTLLLAPEGINGTIAGTRTGIYAVLKHLRAVPHLGDLTHKESTATEQPFHRMKVRLKKEIVTIGMADVDPNETVGTYVAPKDWNKVISDPDTIVIDTRNGYEIGIGTFKGAVDPRTESFRAFPDYVRDNLDPAKNRKVAMFCTGGIRCEKASSLMKKLGFEEVYHLQGGILKYLEEVPPQESLWEGECFVFDQRVSVGHGLRQGDYILCPSCRHPVSAEARLDAHYEEGVSCPHCSDSLTPEKRDSARERHKQMKLAAARGEKHIGAQYNAETEE